MQILQVLKCFHHVHYIVTSYLLLFLTCTAANAITSGKSYLDAIELGCNAVEHNTSVDSVGYGGRYVLLAR